jgi:hypothetical protein
MKTVGYTVWHWVYSEIADEMWEEFNSRVANDAWGKCRIS